VPTTGSPEPQIKKPPVAVALRQKSNPIAFAVNTSLPPIALELWSEDLHRVALVAVAAVVVAAAVAPLMAPVEEAVAAVIAEVGAM
jgi:hypothetical protein